MQGPSGIRNAAALNSHWGGGRGAQGESRDGRSWPDLPVLLVKTSSPPSKLSLRRQASWELREGRDRRPGLLEGTGLHTRDPLSIWLVCKYNLLRPVHGTRASIGLHPPSLFHKCDPK